MTLTESLEEYQIVKQLLLRNIKGSAVEAKYQAMLDLKEAELSASVNALTKGMAKVYSDMKTELNPK